MPYDTLNIASSSWKYFHKYWSNAAYDVDNDRPLEQTFFQVKKKIIKIQKVLGDFIVCKWSLSFGWDVLSRHAHKHWTMQATQNAVFHPPKMEWHLIASLTSCCSLKSETSSSAVNKKYVNNQANMTSWNIYENECCEWGWWCDTQGRREQFLSFYKFHFNIICCARNIFILTRRLIIKTSTSPFWLNMCRVDQTLASKKRQKYILSIKKHFWASFFA